MYVGRVPAPDPLAIAVEQRSDGYFLRLSGALDHAAAPRLEHALAEIDARSGDRVVFDMADLELIDSTGLALVVSYNLRASQERFDFSVYRPTPPVRRVLEITTIDRWLTLEDEIDEPAPGSELLSVSHVPVHASDIGGDLDRLSRRLELSQETLRSRRSVTPSGDGAATP